MRIRNQLLVAGALALGLVLIWNSYAATPTITVYKDPGCGCCSLWVQHLEANGFAVDVHNVPNIADYRRQQGVPERLAGCHTGVIDGYTIEGHVPAAEIHRLLQERPQAKGLTVPGMPLGAPGMDTGSVRQSYAVLLFQEDGSTSVYRDYPGQ